MDTNPQNLPLGTNQAPPPMATPAPQQTTKSGCGCCGCFFGCVAIILIPIIALVVLYFTVDFGKVSDGALIWGYHNVFKTKILEPSLSGAKLEDRKITLEIFDSYVDAYEKLPDPERKLVREEAWRYIYYQSQNEPVPPEKVVHFNRFIQNQLEILKAKYPEIPPEVLKQLPQKTM